MRHQTVAGETIRQIAYVTSPGTFGATIDFWLRTVGVGPFYVADFRLGNQTFRGEPTDCTCRAGLSFRGRPAGGDHRADQRRALALP